MRADSAIFLAVQVLLGYLILVSQETLRYWQLDLLVVSYWHRYTATLAGWPHASLFGDQDYDS